MREKNYPKNIREIKGMDFLCLQFGIEQPSLISKVLIKIKEMYSSDRINKGE